MVKFRLSRFFEFQNVFTERFNFKNFIFKLLQYQGVIFFLILHHNMN